MRILSLALTFAFAAACGNSSGVCENKPGSAPPCAPGVVKDTKSTTCTDPRGDAFICRGGAGYCVVCSGVDFDNGCSPNDGEQSYCVHDCSDC